MWHGLVASSKGRLFFVQRTIGLWPRPAAASNMSFFVYFAKSLKNGKTYVGSTSKDPSVRVSEHNKGANQWTKLNKPFKLIYFERYNCEKDARDRKKFYKSGIGKAIKKLIIENIDKILGS